MKHTFASFPPFKKPHNNLWPVQSFHAVTSRGFTLIETIVVMVLLSIAAVAIINLQGNVFNGQSGNKDLQVGVQLLQECAEQVIAVRRKSGFNAVTTATCSALGNYGGFSAPIITLTADNAGAACPTSGTCNQVVITLSKGGSSLTPVTLELVNY